MDDEQIIAASFITVCLGHVEKIKRKSQKKTTHYKVLIIDGQNNHYIWPKTKMMMKDYLVETDMFSVDIHSINSVWLGIKYNKSRPEPYTVFI